MQMEATGQGKAQQIPAHTITRCVTKEEADHPESNMPKGGYIRRTPFVDRQPPGPAERSDCKLSDVKVDGATVSWKMECQGQRISGDGSITYGGDEYTGVVHIKSPQFAGTQKLSGKRLGDCDGAEK